MIRQIGAYEQLDMDDSLNSVGYRLLSDRLGIDNLSAQRHPANMVNLLHELVKNATDKGRASDSEGQLGRKVMLLGVGKSCVMESEFGG